MSISNFYGIEINDFAVAVAKTALWIAESQAIRNTEAIIHADIQFLPLKSYANIVEGNALRLDWETIVPKDKLNYILGNPPFVGGRLMSEEQKQDLVNVFGANWKNVGNMDYVCAWYKKAIDLIKDTDIRAAFVSTNSICQGEQVPNLWKPLFEQGVHIDFAYRTFRWDSESNQKAHVHCVIVGFSLCSGQKEKHIIHLENGQAKEARNINAYLVDARNSFIESRNIPICNVPKMVFGNMANDGGNFILSEIEKNDLLINEPNAEKFIRPYLGAEEFINNKKRYCLWLKDADPSELRKLPQVLSRISNIRRIRAESKRSATQKLADYPQLFGEIRQPESGFFLLDFYWNYNYFQFLF